MSAPEAPSTSFHFPLGFFFLFLFFFFLQLLLVVTVLFDRNQSFIGFLFAQLR